MTALVQARDLRRVFDVSKPWLNRVIERTPREFLRAVDGVSFDIKRGETFALVGESGSGKSTVARMVVGLLPPSTGDVTINGISMSDPKQTDARKPLRRRIQMIFQDPYASLNPRMRVDAIIAEPIRAFDLMTSERDIRARVGELLRLVGLHPDDGIKFPHQFSSGQRQRIAIARALASEADFIVCDEPVSALDVRTQAQIVALLKSLQEKLGLSYLFIAHDLAIVREMAHKVAVMYRGHVVEMGPTAAVYDRPGHPYTRLLLDAVPVPDPALQRERLKRTPPDLSFLDGDGGACIHGDDHARTGTPWWHDVSPGHGVSCRYWPRGGTRGSR